MNARIFFPFLIAAILLNGCISSKIRARCSGKCETATLFYLPGCKEIKGYVNFDKTGLQRVFQHELPAGYQKDSIQVCIRYENAGVGILMSDCLQSEIIRIKCIEKTE